MDLQEPTRPRDDENGTEDFYLCDVQGWGTPDVWELCDNAGATIVADESVSLITGSVYKVVYDLSDNATSLD